MSAAAVGGGRKGDVHAGAAAEGLHDQLVFSIARELVANAAKHAQARAVGIAVRRAADAVVLVVEDDGRGIDAARARQAPLRGHIGLASCRERAEALGGSLEAAPTPGGGTRVHVALPAPAHGGG
jgi:two-component system NarL family sensor kinase